VAKPELGNKHVCQECDTPFYDLKRSPPACPKCETIVEPVTKGRKLAVEKTKTVVATPAAVDDADDLDDIDDIEDDDIDDIDDDDDDDDLIEDASDLGVDDDDMSEVKEHIDLGIEDDKD